MLHLLCVVQVKCGETRRQPREAPRDGALYLGHGHVLVLHMQPAAEWINACLDTLTLQAYQTPQCLVRKCDLVTFG